MEMMLQTQNLCKYFRKQKAVNNVSLNIEKKQIYGLLGPNGAGKSTTLKMLTGMMKPTAGKIYFDGKEVEKNKKMHNPSSSLLIGNIEKDDIIKQRK